MALQRCTCEVLCAEVDQETTFDVKEPLLDGYKQYARERHVVAADFDQKRGQLGWKEKLLEVAA
eukprot:4457786-Amphidinium_carterae.2